MTRPSLIGRLLHHTTHPPPKSTYSFTDPPLIVLIGTLYRLELRIQLVHLPEVRQWMLQCSQSAEVE